MGMIIITLGIELCKNMYQYNIEYGMTSLFIFLIWCKGRFIGFNKEELRFLIMIAVTIGYIIPLLIIKRIIFEQGTCLDSPVKILMTISVLQRILN